METLCKCLSKCLSKCFCNIFCCKNKNRIVEITPPTINRNNKPVFVNENNENNENIVNEENKENEKYIKYIKVNRKKNTYSNYDEFDYNQELPDIPEIPQLFNKQIKQEIIYNTNLVFSNTDNDDIIIPPPLPPKINRNTKSNILSNILFH